ncbi:unnamed protein product [Arabidopsis thaliana]|uniref:(thale cress) hypothetical protein n=1 Tax=Arabidopsis thaliana TaxID=3702 RepID=A0A7G2E5T4_ARATH|nr:unnamed protein product [Arabidopsis thaliana]
MILVLMKMIVWLLSKIIAEDHFGFDACDDDVVNKYDESGDDVWDDEKIPDPLSDDDDEYEAERSFTHGDRSDEPLALNNTINNADEFKYALLRLYVCFDALKTAWKQSCRPIIGLDAAFMKWDIKWQMLATVGRDGDNIIFPIAWAVVEVEDIDNWMCFVQLVKKDLSLGDGADITMIFDKHHVRFLVLVS